MCMLCARAFTAFRKKHHCRACGRVSVHACIPLLGLTPFTVMICDQVLCGQCSLHTARLEFDDMREHRVCDECYLALTDSAMKNVLAGKHFKVRRSTSLLGYITMLSHSCNFQARAGELSRHSGYAHVSSDMAKTWTRRWLEVHEGGVLYSFKAQQVTTVPQYVWVHACAIVPMLHLTGHLPAAFPELSPL
jgi:hypothetical protein